MPYSWIPATRQNTKIAVYATPDNPVDAVRITGVMMFQKGKWVSLSRMKAEDILRLTNVPSMEFLRQPKDTVEQALDTSLEKYQRPAESSRLTEISNWFGDDGNFIVNSGLVWLPDMGNPVDNLGDAVIGSKETWTGVPNEGDDYDQIVDDFAEADRDAELHKLPESIGVKEYRFPTISDGGGGATPEYIRLREICTETIGDPPDICGWTANTYSDNFDPRVEIIDRGTAYANEQDIAIDSGTGAGMIVNITQQAGRVTEIEITELGEGYLSGDVLEIPGGNDGTFTIANYWFDVCQNCGWSGRPGHLIDGQHRARGAADTEPLEMLATNIIEGDDFDDEARSKIFAEVTNTSKPLDELHRVNLGFRGERLVRAGSVDHDYGLARFSKGYKIAAKLTKGWAGNEVMVNRIHLLPKHPNKTAVRKGRMLNVTQFVKWSARNFPGHFDENWWGVGGPWHKHNTAGTLTVNNAAKSFHNFWDAVSQMWPTAWETDDLKVKNLQKDWILESIFKLYPAVVKRIRDRQPPGSTKNVPSTTEFKNYLRYMGAIDFNNKSSWNNFNQERAAAGQGKKNHVTKILRGLVADAVPTNAAQKPTRAPTTGDVNVWMYGEPTIDSLTVTDHADFGTRARTETVTWTSDTTCRAAARADEPHLLAVKDAEIWIEFDGSKYFEGTSEGVTKDIELPLTDDSGVRVPGEAGTLNVRYVNINGEYCVFTTDVTW